MRTLDLTPFFRSTVGFDRMANLLDAALRFEDTSYPHYNIERHTDNHYRITMAVAGFREADLTLTSHENTLIVSGKLQQEDEKIHYIHRGIAGRAFERRFQLADYIRVMGASLEDGILSIDLFREVPEAMKPRKIDIKTKSPKALEHIID